MQLELHGYFTSQGAVRLCSLTSDGQVMPLTRSCSVTNDDILKITH